MSHAKRFLIRKPFNCKYIYKFKTSRKNPFFIHFRLYLILLSLSSVWTLQQKYVSKVNKKSKPVFLPFSSLLPIRFDLRLEFFNFRVDRAALEVLYEQDIYFGCHPRDGIKFF